jgi:uncharacterized membrane protein YbhN (UPF0104 family)
MNRRPTLKRVLYVGQLLIAPILLVLVWRAVDGRAALRLIASADGAWLFAAMAALTLQTWLSAQRWRFTATRLGQVLPFRRAVGEYYLAQFLNQTLPGGMGGDASRAYRARQSGGLLTSSQAVIFERMAGQAMLVIAMVVGLGWVAITHHGATLPTWTLGLVAVTGAVAVGVCVALWLAPALPGRLGRAGGNLHRALGRAFGGRHAVTAQFLLSLGTTACNLLAFAFCARATGTALGPSAVMALVPLILLAMLIPASVSGWGFREGAAAALFPLAGASPSAGLAASVAFGLVFLVSVLPGALILFGGRTLLPAGIPGGRGRL